MPRPVLAALAIAAAYAVCGPWPAGPAAASCAAPYLRPLDAEPVAGGELTVQGRAFVHGCDDTGTQTAWGCTTDDGETETPMRDVDLKLRQGARVWPLGEADAGAADDERLGHVAWQVRLPADVRPGPATLEADLAEPLGIVVGAD